MESLAIPKTCTPTNSTRLLLFVSFMLFLRFFPPFRTQPAVFLRKQKVGLFGFVRFFVLLFWCSLGPALNEILDLIDLASP